jgi:hypothetical protein
MGRANRTQLLFATDDVALLIVRSNDESNVKALRRVLLQKPETALPPSQVRFPPQDYQLRTSPLRLARSVQAVSCVFHSQIYAIDETHCVGTDAATELAAGDYERRMRALPASTLLRARGAPFSAQSGLCHATACTRVCRALDTPDA